MSLCLETVAGRTYIIRQQRMREVFPYYEGRGNPLLWFAFDRETNNVVITGVKTLKGCRSFLRYRA